MAVDGVGDLLAECALALERGVAEGHHGDVGDRVDEPAVAPDAGPPKRARMRRPLSPLGVDQDAGEKAETPTGVVPLAEGPDLVRRGHRNSAGLQNRGA